jgi:hypothetical protein
VSECLTDTISEITDRFLIRNGVDRKKYFSRYLTIAGEVWEDIFKNTLWIVKSVWMPTKLGDPYNYIDVPSDCSRILSVGVDDKCDLIQPLFYNNQLNVVAKPVTKKCGCTCDCGGLCDDVNSLTVTTKLLFTINGIPYYQKTWMEYCPNGDILQWDEIPTKKYNTLTGDSGDFNDDWNPDWDIAAAPFSAYEIVTEKTQKKICKLAVKPCGCPQETEENACLLTDFCGFSVSWGCCTKTRHCKQFSENINSNHLGEVKISDCGTRIFYRKSKRWNSCIKQEFPDYLLVNYQSTGVTPGSETLVPKFCRNLMYAALDKARKEYNSSFSQHEKDNANYKYIDEKGKVVGFLSPIDLRQLSQVQDQPIRW